MKFLGRKDKSDVLKKPQVQHEGDFQQGVIRVQAPHLNMCTTAVQLDPTTTAADIVARFCHSSALPPQHVNGSVSALSGFLQVYLLIISAC